jgi:short-subunit dehydrogenase
MHLLLHRVYLGFEKMKKSMNKTRYALITGGTSGIGYELAKQAALDGFNLILVARDEEQLQKAASEFSMFSVEVKTIAKDLFNPEAAEEIFQATRNMGISVDLLINDAGQGQHGPFADTDLRRHIEIVNLNIISLMALTHYFLRDMLQRKQGRILQLGSEVSKMPMPLLATYAATKAFVLSFTEALVNELQGTGVTATLLMPGATDTDFFEKADMKKTRVYQEKKLDSPEEVAKAGYAAVMKGDRRIIGKGARKNVLQATITPDPLVAAQNRKLMEPSTKRGRRRVKSSHEPSRRERKRK